MNPRWQPLAEAAERWVTDLGAWFAGKRVVFRGRDLLNDLAPLPWMELLLYGITGRRFTPEQVKLFEQIWTFSISYPDPRLWNNRVAALGGSARTTAALAAGAATAVTEARIYGGQANHGAISFIRRARLAANLEAEVNEELRRRRHVPGYGRPIVADDERNGPVLRLARELGLADGPHLALAFEVERLLRRRRMKMNITGLAAALAADQGLTPPEYQAYLAFGFGAGIVACYVDAAAHPEQAFFPFDCARIEYEGPPPRSW